MRRLEAASFAPGGRTRIMLLSDNQLELYRRVWGTEAGRLWVLPPTLEPARVRPTSEPHARDQARHLLGLEAEDLVWLFIGAYPETKGLDRALSALAACPQAKLLCAGLAESDPKARRMASLAGRLGVARRVLWLGHREDICQLMRAADLLVHPARLDVTGTVILEAIAAGLPVITTALCGYAPHVRFAEAGVVLDEPFSGDALLQALRGADRQSRLRWGGNATAYARSADLYSGLDRAADIIVGSHQ